MNAVAIVQARMGSTRLPGKVLAPLGCRPLLLQVVARLRAATRVADVVVATSDTPGDAPVRDLCRDAGIPVFAGSETDVLDRFQRAAALHGADPVIRITADCPFVDPELVDRLVDLYEEGGYDHVGVATGAGAARLETRFPDGLDAECFSAAALAAAWREADKPAEREHVTPFIWRRPERFRLGLLHPDRDGSHLRLTVDGPADLDLARRIYDAVGGGDAVFSLDEVLRYLDEHRDLAAVNAALVGHEGYDELWEA